MVYNKFMLGDAPIENVVEDGNVVGFCFQMREPDYRGMFLSCLMDIKVILDGEEFSGKDISFTLESGHYTLDNLDTEVFNRWNYIELGTVYVKKPGGIAPGKHHIEAGILKRSSQDNTVGLWGGGDYVGGRRDFIME